MAVIPESPRWEQEIYEIQTQDPVLGGRGGISNQQAQELANRTRHLNERKIDKGSEMYLDELGLMSENGSYNFTGIINIPTPRIELQKDIVP